MSLHRVIDRLETYVRESTWVPMGYRLVSLERVLELVEKLRSTLPEEVGRARVISNNKDRVIREAQERAQAIVHEAAEAHHHMLEQSEIVRRARTTAEIVLREAEERAQKIREGADAYAAQVLAELDGSLDAALRSVRKGEETLARARNLAKASSSAHLSTDAETPSSRRRRDAAPSQGVFDAENATVDESFLERLPVARS